MTTGSPSPIPRFECRDLLLDIHPRTGSRRLNFQIENGRTTLVHGGIGCGKSTLALTLMGLLPPLQGQVYFRGEPMHGVVRRLFQDQNRLMLQHSPGAMNPAWRGKEIVTEPLRVTGRCPPGEVDRHLQETCELVGISAGLLDRYPREMSGGEIQKIHLGRTLIGDPAFVILDEPFASLDELQVDHIASRLFRYFRQMDRGALIFSHRVGQLEGRCDRVYAFDQL